MHTFLFGGCMKNEFFNIFIDRYKRNMFGEKYKYLSYEEYIHLFESLKEINPSMSSDINNYFSKLSNKFKPKNIIKYCTSEICSCIISFYLFRILTGCFMSSYLSFDYKNGDIFFKMVPVKGKNIDKVSEAEKFLGKKVSLDEIINTINNNDKIDDYYKQHAIDLVKYLFNKYPNADLRIFNENMKDISINIVDDVFLFGDVSGLYFPFTNSILIDRTNSTNKEVITHELMHSAHHWVQIGEFLPQIRSEYDGKLLDEAMTNYTINGLVSVNSYFKEMSLLNYLMSFVDYDYYDYEQEGISKLIKLLKEKYPQVDIDYIVDVSRKMTSILNIFNDEFKFEDNEEFTNQLFDICVLSIDYDNIYHSFNKFIGLFDSYNFEFLQKYLDKYNAVLCSAGIDKKLIVNDINLLINMVNRLDSIKSDFRTYLNLDSGQFEKNDLYSLFRDYFNHRFYYSVEYNDIDEIKLFFFDIMIFYIKMVLRKFKF